MLGGLVSVNHRRVRAHTHTHTPLARTHAPGIVAFVEYLVGTLRKAQITHVPWAVEVPPAFLHVFDQWLILPAPGLSLKCGRSPLPPECGYLGQISLTWFAVHRWPLLRKKRCQSCDNVLAVSFMFQLPLMSHHFIFSAFWDNMKVRYLSKTVATFSHNSTESSSS